MPANTDIHYKFFGGKFDFQDIALRLLGLPAILIACPLIYFPTKNTVWALIVGVILFIIGYIIGAKKVFESKIPFLIALTYQSKLNKKSKVLINKREYETVGRTPSSIEDTIFGKDEED